ncbi:D-ribose pyranase [Corynebacterium hindlerae]|uniref:D-ribose pyranase n=1 Tax=Corynebacterium hindlerae TaxID=699041 RepID=UPI001AD65523|nr:D-ribose pyranase [Corynebacterium hindlerae]QTH58522.1 D-ribose pyranase [Corynebacterium hindlerae]
MRKAGILNAELAAAINRLGHTDTFAIADCGLPIPDEVEVIDLALVFGVPSFESVVRAVLAEVVVQEATIADTTPDAVRTLIAAPAVQEVSHEKLKARIADVKFVIRTGETTPFANVIFTSGVAF